MAADLAKVSLWLTAMSPGRPLSFLDHHVKVGNALLGTTPGLLHASIPDAAYVALTGDDKSVAAAWRKRNAAERAGQGDLFDDAGIEVDTAALRKGTAAQGFLTPADIGSGGEILSTARSFPASAIGRARSSAGSAAYAVCIGATLGKTGWSADPLGFNQQINAVMTADAQEAALLAALMSAPAFQAQMWAGASATTMPILNKGRFLTLKVPFPPEVSRGKLMTNLEGVSAARARLLHEVQRSATRLLALRRALLHAAVAGQLPYSSVA